MSKRESRSTPQGKAADQPTNLAPGLLPLAGSLLSPLVGKGAEAVGAQLMAVEPIFVQVLNSYEENQTHHAFFRLTNNTQHGVYVESIEVSQPGGDYSVQQTSLNGNVIDHMSTDFLPYLVRSGSDLYFKVAFAHCQHRGPKTDWSGELILRISRLEADAPKDHHVNFRIRWENRDHR